MNLVWITSDTLRCDSIGAYGSKIVYTPSMDNLAAKSMRFDRHYAASFPTMPARADFLTGRWSMSFMGWEPLPPDQTTVAQVLAGEGFHTAGIVDTPFYIRGGMNYDRGFQSFIEIPGQATLGRPESKDIRSAFNSEYDRFAPKTFYTAMQWLEYHYQEDFFLYIDTWDPHDPWDAPKYYTERYWPGYDGEVIPAPYDYWQKVPGYTEERVKKALATYWGEVTMVDTWLGYFLRKLENMNLMENTAIIFTTDHGFYFGEHGGMFGKAIRAGAEDPKDKPQSDDQTGAADQAWDYSPLFEELVAIPLLIYVPNNAPGNYQGLTSAIDLMPTVMDIMGVEAPSFVEGQSLLPKLRDTSLSGREYVVSTSAWSNAGDSVRIVDDMSREMAKAAGSTVTTDEWSLLYAVEPGLSSLYNLKSDPKQEKNVINEHTDVANELLDLMVKLMRETNVEKRLMETRLELRL
jgi:arylsulfatase A-like enzyme